MLKEVPEALLSINQEVEMLQTQPSYQTGGATRTFCKLVTGIQTKGSSLIISRIFLWKF